MPTTNHVSCATLRQLPALTTALILSLLLGTTSTQAQTLIPLSTTQIQRAQIKTSALSTGDISNSTTPGNAEGLHLSGTVVAPANAAQVVSSTVSGIVQTVQASSLQAVSKGSTIVTLYSQQLMEMQREYIQLATQAKLAKDKQERDDRLFNEGIIANSRVQDSRAAALQADIAARERYHSLRSAGMSEQQLHKLSGRPELNGLIAIAAQKSGTLSDMSLHPGQRIEAGMPIATISSDHQLWIEFPASEKQAAQIRIGDQMLFAQCAPARVIAISSQVQSGSQTRLIRAQANNQDGCLKINQFVEARHQASGTSADGIRIPSLAIVRNSQADYVFVRHPQGFLAVRIQLISQQGNQSWVKALNGKLDASSQVATQGLIALKGAWAGLGAEESGDK